MLTTCLLSAVLPGCGGGYAVQPGQLAIDVDGPTEQHRAFEGASHLLAAHGFKALGTPDATIDALERLPAESHRDTELIARLPRERHFENEDLRLSVTMRDYSETAPSSDVHPAYPPPFEGFVEISVYESRPGGFSPEGHAFFSRLHGDLRTAFPRDIALIREPPATDQAEYRRVILIQIAFVILEWCVAFLVSLLFIGMPTRWLVGRLPLRRQQKQLAFALLGAWLSTPVPLPAALTTIAAPNVLLLPWNDVGYYAKFGWWFPCSLLATLLAYAMLSRAAFPSGAEQLEPSTSTMP